MLIVAMFALALAGPGYDACCEATAPGNCPTMVEAVGPGSALRAGGGPVTLTGVWQLACDTGPRFLATATKTLAFQPEQGKVLTPLPAAAAACFTATCALPESLCLISGDEGAQLVHCAAGTPAGESAWTSRPRTPGAAAIIDGRVYAVRAIERARAGSPTSPVTSDSPAPPPPPPSRSPTLPASAVTSVDRTLPSAPPSPCIPPTGMRDASNDQVGLGNEALVRGDVAESMNRYRAALTLNPCNAFAWAAIGDTLAVLADPSGARSAFQHSVSLMPSHFHAWTGIGNAEETLGNRPAAAAAFRKALEYKPGHPPATAGLTRVGR